MASESLQAAFPEAAMVGQNLRALRMTVAVAESCTGGLLGAALTATAGASDYIRGGVIAYADDLKVSELGVERATLQAFGAVSAEVAAAMAGAVRKRFSADIGIGITGVAGPGESERKPAGLVYVALASVADTALATLEGDQGREANRARAVRVALSLCAEHLAACAGAGEGQA